MKLTEYNRTLLAFDSIIKNALEALESQRTCPSSGADASDDYCLFHRERAARMRALRAAFEDEMARTYARQPL